MCAERLEASGEGLVAAIYRIDIMENGMTGCSEHREEDNDGGAKGGRGDDFGWLPVGRAFDEDAVGIE